MDKYFNLYTNSSEYRNTFPDKFGRARFYNAENSNIFNPVISKEIYSSGFRPHYPDQKKFAVCVSHDIDHLFIQQSAPRKVINMTKGMIKGQFSKGLAHFKSLLKDKIGDDYNLKRLTDIDNKYKVKGSYYFLALENGEEDYNYYLKDIHEQFNYVIENKNEIGLHGGHKAYSDLTKLHMEKQKLEEILGQKVQGYRNHYLRFELPVTWNNLQHEDFLYDSTLGYADCVGFRNGMCYPYYPFDIIKNCFLDIVELPLVIMDATLFYYMRLDADVAFKICKKLIDQIKECNGVLTLLWHNNFLNGDMGAFYVKMLEYLQSEDPWFATSLELVNWWKGERLLEKSKEIVEELIKG